MQRFMYRGLHQKAQGQALVLVALIITFLFMLILTCIEIGARYQELAQIEDALKQATRSSVQAFDYAAFARGGQLLREISAMSITGCASLAPNSARTLACTVFQTNLIGVSGVQDTPDQTAARVQWTFLPQGGTCTFPNGYNGGIFNVVTLSTAWPGADPQEVEPRPGAAAHPGRDCRPERRHLRLH